MAYMDQERKAAIAAELKKVVPQGWKYTLAVHNHSTIVMNISAAPIDLIRAMNANEYFNPEAATYADVNPYHYKNQFADEKLVETFDKILKALNTGNWDKSNSMTDYFNVGWYVDVNIGKWNKPFQYLAPVKEAA